MINQYGLRLDRILHDTAGSYLQTVRYESHHDLLCPVCGGFRNPAYPRCRSCETLAAQTRALQAGLGMATGVALAADRIACGVYAAEPASQTLKMMYGYKAPHPPSPDYRRIIRALTALALVGHGQCLDESAGMPVSGWVMVPSTTGSPRFRQPHPLHDIIQGVLPNVPEIRLTARKAKTRNLDPDAFALADPSDRRHLGGDVVLVDDSWVTGGTVLSAAARLKLEGAAQVSVYCVARIVSTRYLDTINPAYTRAFHRKINYISAYCPWHRHTEPDA
ncbi:phosphoribosyltransferase [Bifidobacterium callitrichos]|uniref:Putative amidophosphoribosyltransferase n=1 Tax=Bifidobacterium callitrichos DSM 23973 TaxID=1437609 RepID=A0A087A7J5_9BIFI|nr:phosphoribosyltransferase [Bifidobacterium callitrichos]KFI54745.1 putative amidophosphoribosyltransferase [Bifidobacterium callitrichos DSM 23973]